MEILAILCFISGCLVGIGWYRMNIILNVINKGQYFIQTKDSCYIVIEAHPQEDVIPILNEEGEENEAQ